MNTSYTRDLFEEIVSLSRKIEDGHQDSSILFVDLAGSTEFKVKNGAILGLQKTFIHNSLVTQTVTGKGEIVKYIGDEVMIVVKGPDNPSVACRLAIDIQLELARLNEGNPNNPLFPIEAKIGIHSGNVLYWKYPGHEQLDPQGTVVDTAARIVSLAKPKQCLCSQETSQRANLDRNKIGPLEERDVKGIRETIKVLEIIWDEQLRGIAQHPLPCSEDATLRQLIRECRREVLRSNFDAGARALESALASEPKDFRANLLLGEILTRQKNQITEGRKYLERARRANSNSPKLSLLEGFLEWQECNKSGNPESLDRSIEFTEQCLTLADDALDFEQGCLALGNLAYYLAQRGRGDDLDRAPQLCEEASAMYRNIETREIASFLDTYAFVLLKRGGEDNILKARELLEDAIKRDKQNPYPHQHMAELIRKEQELDIKPASGWIY